jgi:hypothetical protein
MIIYQCKKSDCYPYDCFHVQFKKYGELNKLGYLFYCDKFELFRKHSTLVTNHMLITNQMRISFVDYNRIFHAFHWQDIISITE